MKKLTQSEIGDILDKRQSRISIVAEASRISVGEGFSFDREEWGRHYHPTSLLNGSNASRNQNLVGKQFKVNYHRETDSFTVIRIK